MNYLERNAQIMDDLRRSSRLQPGIVVGGGNLSEFRTMGASYSSALEVDLHVGVKKPKERTTIKKVKKRMQQELAVITAIAEHLPHLISQLPLFYGLLVDLNNSPLASVTEDFSEGGKVQVAQIELSPLEVREIQGVFRGAHEEFIERMAFQVGPDRKLGDFYPFFRVRPTRMPDLNKDLLRLDEIESDLARHSLEFDGFI